MYYDTMDKQIDFENLESLTGETDEKYEAFVEKFKPKKTTDDCFTPPEVYEIIKNWVMKQYNIPQTAKIVRPFYPGGDYKNYDYPKDCVVIDNPPFSLISQIVLFAPTLTLFSTAAGKTSYIVAGAKITYQNGANVNTSFVTNLEKCKVRIVGEINELIKNTKISKKKPKYEYPKNIISAAILQKMCRYDVDIKIPEKETFFIRKMEKQKSGIYGAAFLISDQAAEKIKEEMTRIENIKQNEATATEWELTEWELSEKEKDIIKYLTMGEWQE